MYLNGYYPDLAILNLEEPGSGDHHRLLLLFSGDAQISIPANGRGLRELFDYLDSEQEGEELLDLYLTDACKALYDELIVELGARCAIVELDYIDRDAHLAYVKYASRAFWDYPRRTTRIHFFDRLIRFRDLRNQKKLNGTYLGFVVLSPANPSGYIVEPGTISRSITALPPSIRSSNSQIILGHTTINLAGAPIEASGSFFAQQDALTASCAAAAIWMCISHIADRYGSGSHCPSQMEITHLATKYTMPLEGRRDSPGLNEQQMMWSLNEMGYEPVCIYPRSAAEATEAIFSYINSGIPPILILDLPKANSNSAYGASHAVTTVGHLLDPSRPVEPHGQSKEPSIEWCHHSNWVSHFFVNDDQRGRRLELFLKDSKGEPKESPELSKIVAKVQAAPTMAESLGEGIESTYADARLRAIIAPLPTRHVLQHDKALDKGRTVIEEAFRMHSEHCGDIPEPAVYRAYLTPSNEYKRHFLNKYGSLASDELSRWYLGSSFPRFIWVIELTSVELAIDLSKGRHKVVAEVTLDPDSSAFRMDFVTMHLPGCFLRTERGDNEVTAIGKADGKVSNDRPYVAFQLNLQSRSVMNEGRNSDYEI